MKNLKLVLVTLLFLVVSIIEAQAQVRHRGPRYNPNPHRIPDYRPAPIPRPIPDYRVPDYRPAPVPDYYERGRVSCSASDTGWEEHWSSHGSCGECLRHHGSCVERCEEIREACDVQGVDYAGRTITFTARAADRWSAEAEARRQCEWDRNMRSCVVTSCRPESQTISSRSCR